MLKVLADIEELERKSKKRDHDAGFDMISNPVKQLLVGCVSALSKVPVPCM